jgi:WD40 repeat protein
MRRLLILLVLVALPVLTGALPAQVRPELVVSVGHSYQPSHAAFVGGYLATANGSKVALIDLATGLTVAHLQQSGIHIVALEASPVENVIAVGACGRAVELWDVTSRRLVHRFAIRRECGNSVSFSPDGALLAIATVGCCEGGECCPASGRVQIWDVRSGTLKQELQHDTHVSTVVFGRDGRWLASVDYDGNTTVFEWPSGRRLRTFKALAHAWSGLSSPDGKYLAWRGFSELQVWDVTSGTQIALPAPPPAADSEDEADAGGTMSTQPPAAEFLNDGRFAYVDGHHLRIVTLPNGPVEVRPLEPPKDVGENDIVLRVAPEWRRIHRDGRTIAGTYEARTVLWDIGAATLRDLTSPVLTDAESLRWTRSGIVAWGRRYSEDDVEGWNDTSGEPIEFDEAGRDALFEDDERVRGLVVRFENEFMVPDHVASTPDRRWVAAALRNNHGSMVKVWPAAGGSDAVALDTDDVEYGPQPTFSADSRWLATFTKGNLVKVRSTGSWKLERTLTIRRSGKAIAFAPHGPRLAIAATGEAAIWNVRTGRKLVTFTGPGASTVGKIAWSPDGGRVVTSSDDGVLRFWNAANGRPIASFYALGSSRDWLLVTPDGRFDGSEGALATVVAWRMGDRVSLDEGLTNRHRVRGLWRNLSLRGARR